MTFTVVVKDRSVSHFPDVPVGSVVKCDGCGRFWRRQSDWPDGVTRWSREGRFRRWQRMHPEWGMIFFYAFLGLCLLALTCDLGWAWGKGAL